MVETLEQEAARVAVAKQVCASCPVLDVCLAYALRTRPTFGVWAGRTAGELAELAESPRAAAARARRGRAVA
ncbi:MAG TPA: WhiB family transcriptional regulator [Streptosporangiaceae bacterium]|nr:WhiB family transcriptional regulator [Streptosporangiaceae bacterium]